MNPATPFHPLRIPISGTNLIEASAGTGKTYGIAALFARLIVLEQLSVENILVVTFTKAATAELKTRLRTRLDEALGVLEALAKMPPEHTPEGCSADDLHQHYSRHSSHPAPDAFIFELLEHALSQDKLPRLIVRLKAAIGQFDNAAIFTIHGFCQRILRDHAFLCQVPFDTELNNDDHKRLLPPAQDFWHRRIVNDPVLAKLVFDHRHTPQTMLAAVRGFLGRPYLSFRRPETDLAAVLQDVQQQWQSIISQLPELAELFWKIHPSLNGNSYRKNTYEQVFAGLQNAAAQNHLPDDKDNRLSMLAADVLADKLKKGKSADSAAFARLHALAVLGQSMAAQSEAEADTLTALQLDLIAHLNQALDEQKKNRRERNFNDLLLDVHHALTAGEHADALADTICRQWQVALIDEFQDTDPLQYDIFSRIFIRNRTPLFLVGDPKQAIYSFRGADIYAYLQAAADADHRYTLAVNYRSHNALVKHIGRLFRQKKHPFVIPDIDYAEVQAARADSRLSPPQAALNIRWLHGAENDSLNKEPLRHRAADACADEIADALNRAQQGRLNYKDAPLQSGDIAVLVRTHNEGRLIADTLKTRGIQSVVLHQQSVFAAAEAEALAALIGFWLRPQRLEPLRFVLGGVLFDYSADDLYALNQDEQALLAWIDSAEAALPVWQQHGFYAAMQAFAARHGLETRLLAAGKTRSLTNYHQLLEILAEEDEQSHTPASLHQWLLAEIQNARAGGKSENHVLRLESDEALVKIITIHASKGLEYPLVYCPFAWDAANGKANDWQILHRSDKRSELLAKHQLDEADRKQLADEEAAEDLRLLYVALTRAAEQLTIYAAQCDNTAYNSFAYLLEGSPDTERTAVIQAYADEQRANHALGVMQMLRNNWQRFVDAADSADVCFHTDLPVATEYRPTRNNSQAYRTQPWPERSFQFIRHTSFTALSRHTRSHERDELQPAIDPAEAFADTLPPPSATASDGHPDDIHHFPRGAHTGICLHELLERLDFAVPAAEQHEAVCATLTRYGFDEQRWLPAVNNMLDATRRAPLTGNTALCSLSAKQRLPEMAFLLHLSDFSLPQLRAWFARPQLQLPPACIAAAALLDFNDVSGFLNGFIDMLCQDADGRVCIIDYKSNHLGMHAADYTAEAMNAAMAEHHYYLQALIYAIATARHFRQRGHTPPVIAVRYLFLRGLDGSGNGIWQWDIPTAELADWLDSP